MRKVERISASRSPAPALRSISGFAPAKLKEPLSLCGQKRSCQICAPSTSLIGSLSNDEGDAKDDFSSNFADV